MTKEIRIHREADVNTFETHIKSTEMELSTNVESMWHKFFSSLRKASDKSVPIKKVDTKSPNQPIWFNKQAKKRVNKQHMLYNKFKSTSDSFHLELYRKLRRSNKKALQTLKKFASEKVSKPLLKGNSKPFNKYLRSKRSEQHPITYLQLSNEWYHHHM